MEREKIFNLALKAFLFLSPLFFFRSMQLSFARGMFFIISTFALFGITLGIPPRRKFANGWISLFLILALIRVFFDNSFGNMQAEWFNFWFSFAGFIYVFCGVLLFYLVFCYADNIKSYLKPVVFVCILNLILVIAQLLGKDFMWMNAPSVCGFMENPSQLGQYSAMAIPVVFYLNPFLALIPLSTLIISKSITPILASIAMGITLCFQHKHRILIIVTIAVCLLIAGTFNFNYIKSKFVSRPVIWSKTLNASLKKPYLGGGYKSFDEQVINIKGNKNIGGMQITRPQSDLLHTAQELGYPILICIAGFFFGLFKKFRGALKDKLTIYLGLSVGIVMVNMIFQSLIRYASISGTFIVLLALLCIKLEGE